MSELLFYMLSICLILASLSVSLSAYPMHSILSLITAFILTSMLWLNLGAEFLALALLFVYVGAVMVLFLFIVFMLNANKLESLPFSVKWLTLGSMMLLLYYLSGRMIKADLPLEAIETVSNTKALGILLYTKYWITFELLGCVLLATMVAVIRMVDERVGFVKTQNITDQLNRTKEDCIRWM